MKLYKILKMELKFISAQSLTTLLILAYPFILMLIIGPTFSSLQFEGVTVAVHYGEGVDQRIQGLESLNVITAFSEEELKTYVKSGRAILGISLNKDLYGRTRTIAYYDLTKEIIASQIALQIQGQFADEAAEAIETNLVSVWQNMKQTTERMNEKLDRIPELKNAIYSSQQNLAQMRQETQNLDLSDLGNSLNVMESDLSNMRNSLSEMQGKVNNFQGALNQLDSYGSKLDYYDGKLLQADNQLANTESQLSSWDSKLAARITQLNNVYNTLNTYLVIVRDLKSRAVGEDFNSLQQVENGILNAMYEIETARNDLQQMRSDLNSMLFQIQNARNDISAARNDIQSTKANLYSSSANYQNDLNLINSRLSEAQNNLVQSQSSISNARNSLGNYATYAHSINNYLIQSETELRGLYNEVEDTETLLRSALQEMNNFIEKNPLEFVPGKLETRSFQENLRFIDLLFPMIIGIVSMLSCMLIPPIMTVKQRSQGLKTRLDLSFASSSTILLGRFLGVYLVGLLQVLVVIFAGVLLFGIKLGSAPVSFFIAVMIAPAVFTALGFLIAAFVTSEGSAVLSSLLLSVPMLFLSGIILPIEYVHGAFRILGTVMPLYNVIEMISKVSLREVPAYAVLHGLLLMFYLGLFLIIAYKIFDSRRQ